MSSVLERLPWSDEQRNALLSLKERPNVNKLIVAAAGSGKSTLLLAMGDYVVEELGVDPSEVMFLTYTASAGENMRVKTKHQFRILDTFHATASTVLGQYNLLEVDTELYHCDEQLRQFALFLRGTSRDAKQFKKSIKYMFIDEVQDSNSLMMAIPKAMMKHTRIIAVGDFRQAIMAFQGGSAKHMKNFSQTFAPAEVLYLSVNRRCSTPIVRLARAIIERGEPFLFDQPPEKSIEEDVWERAHPQRGDMILSSPLPRIRHYYNNEQLVEYACHEIARLLEYYKPHQLVILARTNAALMQCRAMLSKMKIANILLRRVTMQSKIAARKRKRDEMNGVQSTQATTEDEIQRQLHEAELLGKVVLATIHSAKGLEWDNGLILQFDDLIFPSIKELHLQIERNLAYVAVTRFRKTCTIYNCFPQTSTFLLELERDGVYDELFDKPIGGFTNNSKHLDSEALDEEDEKVPTLDLSKKNWNRLINSVDQWVSQLNGCSYHYIKESLLPYPMDLEIKSVPILYTLPRGDINIPNGGQTQDDKVEDEDEEEEDGLDAYLLPTEVVEDEEADLEPHQHSKWIQKECLEDEVGDFLECWIVRFLQQMRRDYNGAKLEQYGFAPAEVCFSDLAKKSKHIDLGKLKRMFTSYTKCYQNCNLAWDKSLLQIFLTSTFLGFSSGNLGVVYVNMKEEHLLEYKFMLDETAAILHYLIYGNQDWEDNGYTHPNWSVVSNVHTGRVAFILIGTRLILWTNQSAESGGFPQEVVIKAFAYAALRRAIFRDKIEYVQVYHLFARKICTVRLNKWMPGKQIEFLKYLQAARRDIFTGFSSTEDDDDNDEE